MHTTQSDRAYAFKAQLTMEPGAKAVLPRGGYDGTTPSFNFAGSLVACRVRTIDGSERLPFGTPVEVEIEVIAALDSYNSIRSGSEFKLNYGGLVVASGRVGNTILRK